MRRWWSNLPSWARWVIGGVVVLLLLAIVVSFFRTPSDEDDEMSFSDVLAAGRAGEIDRIEMHGGDLDITTRRR